METVLFCIPLKNGRLRQYEIFAKATVEKAREYREMLARYDIKCAKIWHKRIGESDYIFVYHEVGPDFRQKMKKWDTSEHPFDRWFREGMMALYDIESAAGMEEPELLVDFHP